MAPGEARSGAGAPVRFSFSTAESSTRRAAAPLPRRRPQSGAEPELLVEYVTSVDSEAGFAVSNPRAETVRVVPTIKDNWPPENCVHGTLALPRSVEEMETLVAGPNNSSDAWEVRQKLLKELADQKLRYELRTLPEQATLERYEDLPVEEFGEALLRGMGWEEGQPVGRNATAVVAPVETVRRPRFLGLGAVAVPRRALRDLRASRAA